jgi:hypothetical protein
MRGNRLSIRSTGALAILAMTPGLEGVSWYRNSNAQAQCRLVLDYASVETFARLTVLMLVPSSAGNWNQR